MNTMNTSYFPLDGIVLKLIDFFWVSFRIEVVQNRRRYGEALDLHNLPMTISPEEFNFSVPRLIETFWVKHSPDHYESIVLCSKRLPLNLREISSYLGIQETGLERLINNIINPMPIRRINNQIYSCEFVLDEWRDSLKEELTIFTNITVFRDWFIEKANEVLNVILEPLNCSNCGAHSSFYLCANCKQPVCIACSNIDLNNPPYDPRLISYYCIDMAICADRTQ